MNSEMDDAKREPKFRTVKIAPDGEFGYLIALGLAIPSVRIIFLLIVKKYRSFSISIKINVRRPVYWVHLHRSGYYTMIFL